MMKGKKYSISLARPWFDSREPHVAADSIASRWLISGPKVQQFERTFARMVGVKHAVAVCSGSAALLVIQQAYGIKGGDEVIVPDMTFVSTASASLYLGARPVFADIEMKTYGMDPGDIESRITKKTKAIIPVHYAGQACDIAPIVRIAKKHGLVVIEDAAEAHWSRYKGGKRTGALGDAAIFSFTPSKPMTTGEGGMIVTDDADVAKRCLLIRNFYDVGKFQWKELGFHFRMPEVMGAIGLVQLKKLPAAVLRRRSIGRAYTRAFSRLPGLIVPWERTPEDVNYQLYTLRIVPERLSLSRDRFIEELMMRGVQARLYYPCLHSQGVFRQAGCRQKDSEFPHTVAYADTAFSLPIYPDLRKDELRHIIASVTDIVRKYKKI